MKGALRYSLRLRLIIGAILGVILAILLAGMFIANLYRIHATDSFQSELDHHLDELAALIAIDAEGRPRITQRLSDPQFNIARSGFYWQVEGGGHRLRSASLVRGRTALVAGPDASWGTRASANGRLRQRSARIVVGGRPLIVTVAAAEALLEQQLDRFRADLILSMMVVAGLLLAGAVALVRLGLAPVRRLEHEVDRLRHGETERLDPRVPTEFAPIVERFNALLEGQAQLIARARTESGNLAHNLRTPLSLVTDEAEQLRLAGQQESADFLLERCAEMQRQIDYHLARAAAAGTRGAGTLTEVAPLMAQIVKAMQRLHAERPIQVELALAADFRLPCDRGDLAEIASNLIDNAFKWAARTVIIEGAGHYIEIRDDGPGIPADQRDAVLVIGARLDPNTPGTGLGLAATADLMRFYGGQLILAEAPEGGLLARVAFAS